MIVRVKDMLELKLGGLPLVFFVQAEDGIRDLVRSRGLGDVYKRQGAGHGTMGAVLLGLEGERPETVEPERAAERVQGLSLIHI